ncbi:MAG: segregation/condensation protein A [Oscillospiraceae bacterium]|nr:segregation/condensation protein A [Oscillospiraceae bacterium]
MSVLNFKIAVFEGPLDLLLSLISKHKLNIMDIEISVLLEQFLAYLDEMTEADMEITGEFLEMAARLIYIKSLALLPKHEFEAAKKELEGLLIEYDLCKKAALKLRAQYIGDDIFVRRALELSGDFEYSTAHDPYDLYAALKQVLGKEKPERVSLVPQRPFVPKSYVAVFTKVMFVLRRIRFGGKVMLDDLYKGQTRSEQVAIFLALLELSRFGRVNFSADNKFLILEKREGQT